MTRTERTAELCAPDDEAEALALEAELRDHGIAPLRVRTRSSGIPGITSGWGTIRVPEADLERGCAIAAAWYERDEESMDDDELSRQAFEAAEIDPEGRRALEDAGSPYRGPEYPQPRGPCAEPVRSISTSLAVAVLSIFGNLVLLGWMLADAEPALDARDATGRLSTRWSAGEFPEDTMAYDTRERMVGRYVDRDRDGRPERGIVFAADGRRNEEFRDADEDGRFEAAVTFDRDDGVTARLRDTDDDDRYDEMRVYAGAARDGMTLYDRDADGFFETVSCDGFERRIACP